jgi:hypothetical protein
MNRTYSAQEKSLPIESYLLDRQTGAIAVQTIQKGSAIMKTQKAPAGSARGLSDAVIQKRYLGLQKLRDAVTIAEMTCAAQNMKKAGPRKAAGLVASRPNTRPNFGGPR